MKTVIRRNLHLRPWSVISFDPFHPPFFTACRRTNPLTCTDIWFFTSSLLSPGCPTSICQFSGSLQLRSLLYAILFHQLSWPILALALIATPMIHNTTSHRALRAGSNLRFVPNPIFNPSTALWTSSLWSTNTSAVTHSTLNLCQAGLTFRTSEHTTSFTDYAAT